jgi:hypothetical protein
MSNSDVIDDCGIINALLGCAAAIAAATQAPSDAAAMRAAAIAESKKHDLEAERLAFLRILDAV